MDLFIFARFHAQPGAAHAVAEALAAVVPASRAEPGCLAIHAFQSLRDPLLFYIHSRWVDEAAFDRHATLPHTRRFIERVAPLVDPPLDVVRTQQVL